MSICLNLSDMNLVSNLHSLPALVQEARNGEYFSTSQEMQSAAANRTAAANLELWVMLLHRES